MKSELSISSWNINKALSLDDECGAARREGVYEYVMRHPYDVHIFIEAYGNSDEELPEDVRRHFEDMGYEVGDCPHHDSEREADDPTVQKGIVYLSRVGAVQSTVVNFDGKRDMPLLSLERPNGGKSQILAVHLDDRTEYARWIQVRSIIDNFCDCSDNLIIAGDFNSMPKDSRVARALRSADFAHLAMTQRDGRVASLLQRSGQMAIGGAYQALTSELNLTDADPNFQPTITIRQKGFRMPESVSQILESAGVNLEGGIFKLDHFLAGGDYAIKKFEVEDVAGKVSDHLAIRAVYQYLQKN